MGADELRKLLEREPFEPFRIRVSSGDVYEVRDPQAVALMKSRLFVAFPDSDRWTFIAFLHIAAVEGIRDGREGRGRRHRPRQ